MQHVTFKLFCRRLLWSLLLLICHYNSQQRRTQKTTTFCCPQITRERNGGMPCWHNKTTIMVSLHYKVKSASCKTIYYMFERGGGVILIVFVVRTCPKIEILHKLKLNYIYKELERSNLSSNDVVWREIILYFPLLYMCSVIFDISNDSKQKI